MKTSAPKQPAYVVAMVCGLAGLLAYFGVVPGLAEHSFWLVTAGFVILALATSLKGL